MADNAAHYDPRYLAGIVLFNRGDFFEAHEVWELLWLDTVGPDKQFYQGLIQAAVGLCHYCNGNLRGALKLYRSSRDYMDRYASVFEGLDQGAFWAQMERCFGPLLVTPAPERDVEVPEAFIPVIELEPPPESWPDPAAYLEAEHE